MALLIIMAVVTVIAGLLSGYSLSITKRIKELEDENYRLELICGLYLSHIRKITVEDERVFKKKYRRQLDINQRMWDKLKELRHEKRIVDAEESMR